MHFITLNSFYVISTIIFLLDQLLKARVGSWRNWRQEKIFRDFLTFTVSIFSKILTLMIFDNYFSMGWTWYQWSTCFLSIDSPRNSSYSLWFYCTCDKSQSQSPRWSASQNSFVQFLGPNWSLDERKRYYTFANFKLRIFKIF